MDSETAKAIAFVSLLVIVALIAVMFLYLWVSNKKDNTTRAALPGAITSDKDGSTPKDSSASAKGSLSGAKPTKSFSFADAAAPDTSETPVAPTPVAPMGAPSLSLSTPVVSSGSPALASAGGPVTTPVDKSPKLALRRRRTERVNPYADIVLPTKASPAFDKSDSEESAGW